MKNLFVSLALLGASAVAEHASSIISDMEHDTKVIFGETPFKWSLTSTGIFNRDTGDEYLRLTHTLTANILKTDKIKFRLAFKSGSVTPSPGVIDYDVAECHLQNNTLDPIFWNVATKDGLYKNDGGTMVLVYDTVNHWKAPVEDLDPDMPFCTPHATLPWYYAC